MRHGIPSSILNIVTAGAHGIYKYVNRALDGRAEFEAIQLFISAGSTFCEGVGTARNLFSGMIQIWMVGGVDC